jgi:hypothetical protein
MGERSPAATTSAPVLSGCLNAVHRGRRAGNPPLQAVRELRLLASFPPPPSPLPPREGVLLLVSTNSLSLVEDSAFSAGMGEGKGEGDRPIRFGQLLSASPSEVVFVSERGENRSIQVDRIEGRRRRRWGKKRSPTDPAALVDGAKEKGENLREKAPCFLRYPGLARSMPPWETPGDN